MSSNATPTGHVLIRSAAADIETFEHLAERARRQTLYQTELDVETLREGFLAFADSALARKPSKEVLVDPVDVDGISGYWFRATKASRPFSLLYLHGGGYVCGCAQTAAGLAASFCLALECPVLAIDYRRAPEHPFPAALEDALIAGRWLAAHTSGPILLGGDSAGGGLAVAAAVALAGAERPHAAGVITVSGTLDLTMSSSSWHAHAGKDLISPAAAPFLYGLYLNGTTPRDPRASPVFAHLGNLPPTMIVAGGSECMLGDSELLARAARACGRDVQFEVYAGMPHNFVKFAHPIADLAFERIGAWVRERFAPLDR